MAPDIRDIEVIAPNLKRRLSGVTATVVRLVPLQARRIGIAATGPGLPPHVPHVPLWRLFLMPRDRLRVWHARRNTEMALGLVLRGVFRRRLAASVQHDCGKALKRVRAPMPPKGCANVEPLEMLGAVLVGDDSRSFGVDS